MADEGRQTITAVEKSMTILDTLVDQGEASPSAVAASLGFPRSTVQHHLNTLKACEMVVSKNGRYRPSLRFLGYGEMTRQRMKLFEIGRYEVDELAEAIGELVDLLIEEHGHAVYLYRAESDGALPPEIPPGGRISLRNTAPGRTILTHVSDERLEQIFDGKTVQTGFDSALPSDVTQAELAQVASQGYAVDRGNRVDGRLEVAAPVLLDSGGVGAVSVVAPSERIDDVSEIADKVTQTSQVINIKGSYS